MTAPGLPPPEFSRPIDIRQTEGKAMRLEANEAERAALSRRFGLVRIDSLWAEVTLSRKDRTVDANGRVVAEIVQSCSISAEDLPVSVDEAVHFRFVPDLTVPDADEEIELDSDSLDEIEYTGSHIDVGEAVSQSLALAIDPFAIGPDAEQVRRKGILGTAEDSSPFAVLKGLKGTE